MEQLFSWFSESAIQDATSYSVTFCKNILAALLIYFVGKWLIKKIISGTTKLMEKRNVEASLASFLSSIIRVSLWLLLIIAIVSMLGIETSSFVALFAGAGMAIGMAMSGTLSNFAGGVMILLFKPFKVGDYIIAQGYEGKVKEIQIFNTILVSVDNKTIIIPNGGLSTGSLQNVTAQPYRRVDLSFDFAYGTDFDEVQKAIADIQARCPEIIKEPIEGEPVTAPWQGLSKLGESGVTIATRSWCKSSDYFAVAGYMNYTVYQELRQSGFMFPFNQLDVKIKQQ
ncbi:MAG: mechanosensitive ion channel [Bacteroidales bacterium]|nr:mechanosensitive ion channel [Bacteroidales bacterium]